MMHQTSREAVNKHLGSFHGGKLLDVGSYDVNGTFKEICDPERWEYLGLDEREGPNVDIVAPAVPWPIHDESFDMVICGSTLEHCDRPWEIMKEIARVLKEGGAVIVTVPWAWGYHLHKDCYRISVDGLRALFEYAGLKPLELYHQEAEPNATDTVGIAKKCTITSTAG